MNDQNQASDGQNQIQKTILEELGLANLPEDKKNDLLIKMTEAVLKRIFLETMEKLSEKDQAAYEALIEEGAGPEKMEEFLREKIAGYEEMVKKIIADFKEEMMKTGESI